MYNYTSNSNSKSCIIGYILYVLPPVKQCTWYNIVICFFFSNGSIVAALPAGALFSIKVHEIFFFAAGLRYLFYQLVLSPIHFSTPSDLCFKDGLIQKLLQKCPTDFFQNLSLCCFTKVETM